MPVKELYSKQEKPQEQLFTEDRLIAASNKKQANNYDIVKSSSGKISLKSSKCVMMLYGPFFLNFIVIEPLTVKKKIFLVCSTAFYIDSTDPCRRDTNSHLYRALSRWVHFIWF